MRKTLIVTTAALFATTAMPSFAQNASATTSADTNSSVETPAVDVNGGTNSTMSAGTSGNASTDANADTDASAGASGSSSMDASGAASTQTGGSMSADQANMSDNSYEAALTAINTSGQVEFEVLDEADITIVRLSELEGDAETGNVDIDAALDANADAMSALHTSVSENETIVSKLEAEGDFTAEDVVAVRTKEDGSLVVYVDDRENGDSA